LKRSEYNQVVHAHSDALYRFALHFLRNVEEARDVVQDCFEKLWVNREQVSEEKAKSWLFTCAHHQMLNFVQRNRIQQQHLEHQARQQNSSVDLRFEAQQLIQELIKDLPPLQKSILLMRDLEGYSYDEIGQMLNISEAQVKVYLFRARMKVKKMVKGQFVLAS
jgi:RNA polymerase sigma-70 factor (ECF subfamily)